MSWFQSTDPRIPSRVTSPEWDLHSQIQVDILTWLSIEFKTAKD